MHLEANGTRLWFDVEGAALVPDGASMRERRTLVLVHGGPGSYDHSYFKPHFSRLTDVAQVVYLDLRDHGRSQPARRWSASASSTRSPRWMPRRRSTTTWRLTFGA